MKKSILCFHEVPCIFLLQQCFVLLLLPPSLYYRTNFLIQIYPYSSVSSSSTFLSRSLIYTGYSCCLICKNSRHKMVLQSITELNSYSSFSNILVFVFPMYLSLYLSSLALLWLPHAFSQLGRFSQRGLRNRQGSDTEFFSSFSIVRITIHND